MRNLKLRSITVDCRTPQTTRFSKEKYLFGIPSAVHNQSVTFDFTRVKTPVILENLHERMNEFKYLPIELFSDETFDTISNEELYLRMETQVINALILCEQHGRFQFVEGEIIDYNAVKGTFRYSIQGVTGTCSRIHFVCLFEDKKLYQRKLQVALKNREYMDSMLRYNQYIDNMPIKQTQGISNEQLLRIAKLIKKTAPLLEVQQMYKRVQNQIMFDKYLQKNKDHVFNKKLTLYIPDKVIPDHGKLQLNFKTMYSYIKGEVIKDEISFDILKKQFQEQSLYAHKQVINIIAYVNHLHEMISKLDFFYKQSTPYFVDILRQNQEHLLKINQAILKQWPLQIQEYLNQQLRQKNKLQLSGDKIAKLMNIIRLKQQETIAMLISRNMSEFQQYIQSSVPKNVKIFSACQVSSSNIPPIFYVLLFCSQGSLQYSFDIKHVLQIQQQTLEKMVYSLSNIDDPEALYTQNYSGRFNIRSPEISESFLVQYQNNIKESLEKVLDDMTEYLKQFHFFEPILRNSVEDLIRQCEEEEFNFMRLETIIKEQMHLRQQIRLFIPNNIRISIFIVENQQLIQFMESKQQLLIEDLIKYLVNTIRIEAKQLTQEYQQIQSNIKSVPEDIFQLEKQRNYLKSEVLIELETRQHRIERVTKIYEMIDNHFVLLSNDDSKLRWNILSYPQVTQAMIASALDALQQIKQILQTEFILELGQFRAHIDYLEKSVTVYSQQSNQSYQTLYAQGLQLQRDILAAQEKAKMNSVKEQLFGLPPSNYMRLEGIYATFLPLLNLWNVVRRWDNDSNAWLHKDITELNHVEIAEFTNRSIAELQVAILGWKQKRLFPIIEIGERMLKQLQSFQPKLPALAAFCEEGMKERHWKELSEIVGAQVTLKGRSLEELLLQIRDEQKLIKLAHQAKQEFQIEKNLIAIYKSYHALQATKSGQHLTNLNELEAKLDDHLIEISKIESSEFKAPFNENITQIQSKILRSLQIIENLRILQMNYEFLMPVFEQADLVKQLPIEVNKFRIIEKFWKDQILRIDMIWKYDVLVDDKIQRLDGIQKSLNDYLDKMRERFNRLYFLSNQELLQILARSDPNTYINKLFLFKSVTHTNQIISSVNLDDESLQVQVQMTMNIDDWLLELQTQIKSNLSNNFKSLQLKQCYYLIEQLDWTKQLDTGQFKPVNQTQSRIAQQLKYLPIESFEWQTHLRYYLKDGKINVKCLQYTHAYEFELMDRASFIAMPSTERCFISFIHAIQNNFYIALHGHQGKQETIRQFSRCLGKYYIVINSSVCNYQLLTQIVKGVCSTGTNCCLAHFEQLPQQLLSILALHLKVLNNARYLKADSVEFDGQVIRMIPNFQFFITCQPQINTEFRGIFRLVHMQEPNLQIIIDHQCHTHQVQFKVQLQLGKIIKMLSELESITPRMIQLIIQQMGKSSLKDILLRLFSLHKDLIEQYVDSPSVSVNFIELFQYYNFVILLGPSLSGKTALTRQLQHNRVYIDSLDQKFLYGDFDNVGYIQQCTTKEYLIFDGPINKYLIEPLTSLFDGDIRFPNGQVSKFKCIYETDSIVNIDPASITRVGLYTLNVDMNLQPEFQWVVQLLENSQLSRSQLIHQFNIIYERVKNSLTVDCAIVYSAAWAFGGCLSTEQRMLVNRQLKDLIQLNNKDVPVYDNIYDMQIVNNALVQQQFNWVVKNQTLVLTPEFQRTQQLHGHILVYGEQSGKSKFLVKKIIHKGPIHLKQILEQQAIKLRSGLYRLDRVYIDDIHLCQSQEFIRQLLDSQSTYNMKFNNLELTATSKDIMLNARLLRHFLVIKFDSLSNQTIVQILTILGVQRPTFLIDTYNNVCKMFKPTPKCPQCRFPISNIFAGVGCEDIRQALCFQYGSRMTEIENRQKIFDLILDEQIFKRSLQDYNFNGLIKFPRAIEILNSVLYGLRTTSVVIFGDPGYGRKTIARMAASIMNLDIPIIDQNIEDQQCIIIKTKIDRSEIKLHLVHCWPWDMEAFQQISFGYFDAAFAIYELYKEREFIAPIKYLHFIDHFKQLHQEQQVKLSTRISKLQSGLDQLKRAQDLITELQMQLRVKRPILEESAREVEQMVKQLIIDRQQVDKAKKIIMEDESIAFEQQKLATMLQAQAKQAVNQANVELEGTLQEVQKLKKEHIVEIKSLGQPPKAVRVILGGVVILLSESIGKVKEDDHFEIAKKYLLNDSRELMELLKQYNRDNIPQSIIAKLEAKILCDPDFTLERAKQCSFAVKFLFNWVKAMYDYNKVWVETQPLRDSLKESQLQLAQKTEVLRQKKLELDKINEQLEYFQNLVTSKQKQKEVLESEIDECLHKIKLSEKLTQGFIQEQIRWTTSVYLTQGQEMRSVGDCLIGAAILAYGGPLSQEQREQFYSLIRDKLTELEYKFSDGCTLLHSLDQEKDHFKENIVIFQNRKQNPLIIDPQRQALKFLQLQVLQTKDIKLIQQQARQHLIGIDIGEEEAYEMNNVALITSIMQKPLNFTIINFTITEQLLEEQLLKIIVQWDNPQLELKKQHQQNQIIEDNQMLPEIENAILTQLNNSISDLLGDETLLNELQNSKSNYHQTVERLALAKQIEEEVNVMRDQYRSVASIFTVTFLVLYEFRLVNPLYQYSLEWFIQQLHLGLSIVIKSKQLPQTLVTIKKELLQIIVSELGQFFTNNDVLVFCLKLSIELLLKAGQIDQADIACLFSTNDEQVSGSMNPFNFISDDRWDQIHKRLVKINVQGLLKEIELTPQAFKSLFEGKLEYRRPLSKIQRLLIITAFRRDLYRKEIESLVQEVLHVSVKQDENIHLDSQLVLLLGEALQMQNSISLGEGQQNKALRQLAKPDTLQLQNCQYDIPFVKSIDIANLNQKLILHTLQCDEFPTNILHNALKRSLKGPSFKSTLTSLNNLYVLHAVLRQRTNLGIWNHQFHENDLELLKDQYYYELVYMNIVGSDQSFKYCHDRIMTPQSFKEGYIYPGKLKYIKNQSAENQEFDEMLLCGIYPNHQIELSIEESRQIEQRLKMLYPQQPIKQVTLQYIERLVPLPLNSIEKSKLIDSVHQLEIQDLNNIIARINKDLINQDEESLDSELMQHLHNCTVPQQWEKTSQPLGQFMNSLFERAAFFRKWNSLTTYNIKCFNYPKIFIQYVLIQYQQQRHLDKAMFEFEFKKDHYMEINIAPDIGVLVYGLKLKGAQYNLQTKSLQTSNDYITQLPLLWLIPKANAPEYLFQCPVYKENEQIFYIGFNQILDVKAFI